jgi:dTDP-4-amino-4,6-dideoxygalactose transaminase
MAEWRVPLSDVRFTDEEVETVAAVFRRGWLSQGPEVAAFEQAFAAFVGAGHAVATSSGTSALHLSLVAAGVRPGDEVVVPSLTFAATAAAVVQSGATPVFADVASPQGPWLSCEAVRAAIGRRTRAVLNVAYGGYPGEATSIRKLADEHGLVLIEDAAHGPGAADAGRAAGTIGHVGAFSFFANKNLPLGEGGMLTTDDAGIAERARLLRSHGLSSSTWERHRAGDAEYDVVEPGFNYRLDEPRAALGRSLLARSVSDNERRRRLARSYAVRLAEIDGVEPAIADGVADRACAWHIYPVLLDPRHDRRAVRAALRAAGVQTSIHYPPLHLTTAFAQPGGRALPATEEYGRRTLTLPIYPHMTDADLSHVVGALASAARLDPQ